MNKLFCIACAGFLAAVAAMADSKSKTPSVVRSNRLQVKAVVEDINRDKREIKVRGPRGEQTLKVGEEVKNFDQIQVGDQINATYYESVAFSVAKKGEAPAPVAQNRVQLAEKGQKPAALSVETRQSSFTVEDIDPRSREMTVKSPQGNTIRVTVDERAGDLKRIKKGDEIVATYTESLAISVDKPR